VQNPQTKLWDKISSKQHFMGKQSILCFSGIECDGPILFSTHKTKNLYVLLLVIFYRQKQFCPRKKSRRKQTLSGKKISSGIFTAGILF